jgi:hypothetical protein
MGDRIRQINLDADAINGLWAMPTLRLYVSALAIYCPTCRSDEEDRLTFNLPHTFTCTCYN